MSGSCVTPLSVNTGEKIYTHWRCHRPLCSPVFADRGDRRGVSTGAHTALRSPRLHSGVCKWYIHEHIHTQPEMCLYTHFCPPSFSHTNNVCIFTSHFRSLINTQIHLHTQTHIRNKSISSSDFWSDVEGWPLRRCIKARYIFLSTRLQGWESQVSVVLGYHTQHAGMLCPFSSKENINNYKSITYCSLLFAV